MRKATNKEKNMYLARILGFYTIAMLCIIYGINLAFAFDPETSYAVALVALLGVGVMLFFTGQATDDENNYVVAVETCTACSYPQPTNTQQET